jgi:hypothetical protein
VVCVCELGIKQRAAPEPRVVVLLIIRFRGQFYRFIMRGFTIASTLAAAAVAAAQVPDEDGRYTISAPGIKAQVSPPKSKS